MTASQVQPALKEMMAPLVQMEPTALPVPMVLMAPLDRQELPVPLELLARKALLEQPVQVWREQWSE